jgi:hypothetical protein
MAIPWIIGAAVVAVGAAVIASSDDDDDYDRKRRRRERELEEENERKAKEALEEAENKRVNTALKGIAKKYGIPKGLAENQLALYRQEEVDTLEIGETLYEYSDKAHQLEEQIEQSDELLEMYQELLDDLEEAEAELLTLISMSK